MPERRLTLRQHGVGVELVPGPGVFSAAAVDPGTSFLLRWLVAVAGRRVLDVGCGYGPLALWLAAADPQRTAVAVDRDAVALACTAAGAEHNGLVDRVRVQASLGYDDLDPAERFDLVVSNVPAKVGPAALHHLLLDVALRLDAGGRVAVVVVERLAGPVATLLAAEPTVVVDDHRANRSYAAWTYHFDGVPASADPAPGFDRGVYRRGSARFGAWEAATSYTIPEFDSLSHATEAVVEVLGRQPLPGPVAVVGVGQGHTALAVRRSSGAVPLRLVDRDLLALRTAAANAGGDVELRHVARPAGELDRCGSAVVALPEKEPVAVTAGLLGPALRGLGPRSPVVLHGRGADVSRVLDVLARHGMRLAVEDRRAVRSGSAALTVTSPA